MYKTFRYRIYPSKTQEELINKHIGASRFIYNLALETKDLVYKNNNVSLSCFDLYKQLPELKKECPWLKEVNSQSLQAPIKHLDKAFVNFYKKLGNFPKYKSKWNGKQSFHICQNIKIENNKLTIPKFKEGINIKLHRELKGVIKSATISRVPSGKYFVSILCEVDTIPFLKSKTVDDKSIGIDLGIKDFAITSEGEIFENPKYLHKAQSKLKYTQRKYSKHKGKRTKHKLTLIHEKVANKRKDFLHNLSSKLVKENHSIAIEDLNVKEMLKNNCLAKSISDVSWSTFTTMLDYKSEWYGSNLLKIGRFEPSSKTCSNCGNINKELQLKDREWTCNNCNVTHDRDINAAVNIKSFALKNILSGEHTLKNQNELPTSVGVLTSEAQNE